MACRLGVAQSGEPRACGDLRHPHANLDCVALSPIKLISWVRVADLSRMVALSGRGWRSIVAGNEADYKKIPLRPEHYQLAVIALRNPKGKRRYGFFSRTTMFGSIASVLHYNISTRMLAEPSCKIIGRPIVCSFDDFGALTPRAPRPQCPTNLHALSRNFGNRT